MLGRHRPARRRPRPPLLWRLVRRDIEDAVPAGAPGTYLIASLGGRTLPLSGLRRAARAPSGTPISRSTTQTPRRAGEAAGGPWITQMRAAGDGRRSSMRRSRSGGPFGFGSLAGGLALRSSTRRAAGTSAICTPATPGQPWSSTHRYSVGSINDVGFATMIRRPGYGNHLEATVDPGIRDRQAGSHGAARLRRCDRLAGSVGGSDRGSMVRVLHRREPR